MNGKTGIIIQCRWKSSRFPGKAMALLSGRPIIVWMQEAAQRTGLPYAFAIPAADSGTPLGIALPNAFLGDENDVLNRFYQCAVKHQFNRIVRLTADCPLVDSRLICRMINDMPPACPYYGITNSPDGNDVEVFTIEALREARASAGPHEREHVTTYLRSMKGARVSDHLPQFAGIKYSIDTPEDLERCQQMVWHLGDTPGMEAYVDYLKKRHALSGAVSAPIKPPIKSKPIIEKSDALYARAEKVIPMCCQTSSKSAHRFAKGFGPKYIKRALGSHVWDADNNEFIDWHMGLGPVTIGHADSRVIGKVTEAALMGNCVTLPTAYEVDLAEKVTEWTKTEKVRFLRTGSDATSAAIRLARAFTGRDMVLRCGYHGWHDWALNADYAEKKGVPQCVRDMTVSMPTVIDTSKDNAIYSREYAAFIIEAISLEKTDIPYLASMVNYFNNHGTVVIFDEVITGLRVAKGGASEALGIKPDLICLGKGLANGWPISAVCGRAEIMDMFAETHISGTYYGETTAMAAALETMRILEAENFWKHSDMVGRFLTKWYQQYIQDFNAHEYTTIKGQPYFTSVQWKDQAHFTLFQQEMLREGILFDGCQFPCLAHNDSDLSSTARAYRIAMDRTIHAIKTDTVMQELQCEVNQTLFRRNAS